MNKEKVLNYIKENWVRSFYQDEAGAGFGGIQLPYPYSSPCIKAEGNFYFFFYWDTYFTNMGLLRHGYHDIAKSNIKNMFWLIERQGYMPNHVGIYNRSQPPFLCRMVDEYVQATGDVEFLRKAIPKLRQEYNFWTTARQTRTGLAGNGHHETAEGCINFYNEVLVDRLGASMSYFDEEKARVGGHFLAEAETGWDFTSRFDGRCLDYNQVELNCLLYEYEDFLAKHDQELNEFFSNRASKRKELINKFLWNDERGLFLDYDFVNEKSSNVASLGTMYALACGIASTKQAERVVEQLNVFEQTYGIAATEFTEDSQRYQWAFPTVWPPLVCMTVLGLKRYGFSKEARQIANKYIATTVELFEQTGQLWEKTDAITGEVAQGEYEAIPIFGWTAGVFVFLCDYIENIT